MRLISNQQGWSASLLAYADSDIPDYAILSHTWGSDVDEVTFEDLMRGTGKDKAGYQKIEFCKRQAEKDGLHYSWIDTCCIDKSSSAELNEAINSMFHWYRKASKCYVYLSDVSLPPHDTANVSPPQSTWQAAFRTSRWFSRGWTLQELLAPASVDFFSREGSYLGNKISLEQQIQEITRIDLKALRGAPLRDFGIQERMSWTKHRETKRPEDKAYSLCGIFAIHMVPLYGEGEYMAIARLRRKIDKSLTLVASSEASSALIEKSERPTPARVSSTESSCSRWCSCRCHKLRILGLPHLLPSAVGNLSIKYKAERTSCNETNCRRRSEGTAIVTYRFPSWLMHSAIRLSLASPALHTRFNLATFRVIPDSAEIFGTVTTGDLSGMQRLFQEGKASVYDVDVHNWTLLHRAFLLGKEDICTFLLSQGVDAYAEADNGSSVIERAWLQAHSNTTSLTDSVIYNNQILMHVDIDDFVQSQQYTVIHKIIFGVSKLQLSLYLETSTEEINTPDARGCSPLWWASAKGDDNAVRTLLSFGADPNATIWGVQQTPLHVARNVKVVRSLLDYGATVDFRDTSGRTPLHCYSYREMPTGSSMIEEIIDRGADVNAKSNAGHTALHYAVAYGHTGLMSVLLKHGVEIDESKNNGDTALALAVRYNQNDAVGMLIESGADPTIKNKENQGLSHVVARFGYGQTMELLTTSTLRSNFSFTAKDFNGLSAIDYFERRQDRSLVLENAFLRFASEVTYVETV